MIFSEMTGIHQVTGYAENCIFPGIAGNDLNRCDAPALQRKNLEQRLKEQLYSLVDSRLRVVEMGSRGQKRVALEGNSERFCANKRLFVRKKGSF